jgi:hypothetical protein
MDLLARRRVRLDLPEFVLVAFEDRVESANADPGGDVIDLGDLVEWQLVESITLQDVALLERRVPGFAAAVSAWLAQATFE